MTELRQVIQESGMVPRGGDADMITEDYRRPTRMLSMKVRKWEEQRIDNKTSQLVNVPMTEITPVVGTVGTLNEDLRYPPEDKKRKKQAVIEGSEHVYITEAEASSEGE
jgi:hypothetical protein